MPSSQMALRRRESPSVSPIATNLPSEFGNEIAPKPFFGLEGALATAVMGMSETTDPVLSLRVALDNPSDETATLAAERIRELGLEVLHVSPRGLLISSRKSRIERVFGARIVSVNGAAQFAEAPKFEQLPRRTSYRIYFPKEPTYF